jgi:hypothetical protein
MDIIQIEKHKRMFHNYGKFQMSCDRIKKHIQLSPWQEDLIDYFEDLKCTALET